MIDYRNLIKNRELRLKIINLLRFIPDKPYLKIVYRIKTGKKLNLEHPTTYCEKLNWLKINNIHPEYTQLADKLAVREHIKNTIGEDYLIPLLGNWKRFDDIDFDTLPNKFVLKCNHDSGSIKIINKNELTKERIQELKSFYDNRLKINPFNLGREYIYKDIKPEIIAEEYIDGIKTDYKFFCFNGMPVLVDRVEGRFTESKTADYYYVSSKVNVPNMKNRADNPNSEFAPKLPDSFSDMVDLCITLVGGIKHVRLDLLLSSNKIYFGEYAFFNCGGFWEFEPYDWELKLGDLITL